MRKETGSGGKRPAKKGQKTWLCDIPLCKEKGKERIGQDFIHQNGKSKYVNKKGICGIRGKEYREIEKSAIVKPVDLISNCDENVSESAISCFFLKTF